MRDRCALLSSSMRPQPEPWTRTERGTVLGMIDEGSLVVLLHGAFRRSLPIEATIRTWQDSRLASLALQRAHPRAGHPLYRHGPDVERGTSEATWQVFEDRHRSELQSSARSGRGIVDEQVTVDDGKRAWSCTPITR